MSDADPPEDAGDNWKRNCQRDGPKQVRRCQAADQSFGGDGDGKADRHQEGQRRS